MTNNQAKHQNVILQLLSFGVAINGLVIIFGTLVRQLHGSAHTNDLIITLPLISGLTLAYLGSLLHRRKRVAWSIAVPVYGFILGLNATQLENSVENGHFHLVLFLRNIILPLALVLGLLAFRRYFNVKSDIRNFTLSLRITLYILLITFVYGVVGYTLFDVRDFHQEISVNQAVHHTIDQFDFTTSDSLTPHSRRAHVFVDSLNFMSTVAVGYAVISLFQPLRAKFTNQAARRQRTQQLLERYSHDSEDYFKLWPTDKTYYFDDYHNQHAALAYRVHRGVAITVGDPVGNPHYIKQTVNSFIELCRVNDWLPTLPHVTDQHRKLYEDNGLVLQKIGEEAVIEISHFKQQVRNNKYFRQINNKFEKQGYTAELLSPPHNQAVIERLQTISDEWLEQPGRQERGFLMGYFSPAYMQQCQLVVARDQNGTIQGFINLVPTFQAQEANFDLLRGSSQALGNVNDYLMMTFIEIAEQQGYTHINLGLCPLSGVGHDDEEKSLIDSTLRFVYANGDRFYSFSGLHRFKAKYEPEWRSRYIAYKGGIRGFSRAVYALNKAMSRIK